MSNAKKAIVAPPIACMLVRPSGRTPASSPSISAVLTGSRFAPATTDGNSFVHSFSRRLRRRTFP